MSLNLAEDHKTRELQTVIVCLKAIRREEQEIHKRQTELQQMLINEQSEKLKSQDKTMEDVKVCYRALKKYGNSCHIMNALAVALKMEDQA